MKIMKLTVQDLRTQQFGGESCFEITIILVMSRTNEIITAYINRDLGSIKGIQPGYPSGIVGLVLRRIRASRGWTA